MLKGVEGTYEYASRCGFLKSTGLRNKWWIDQASRCLDRTQSQFWRSAGGICNYSMYDHTHESAEMQYGGVAFGPMREHLWGLWGLDRQHMGRQARTGRRNRATHSLMSYRHCCVMCMDKLQTQKPSWRREGKRAHVRVWDSEATVILQARCHNPHNIWCAWHYTPSCLVIAMVMPSWWQTAWVWS